MLSSNEKLSKLQLLRLRATFHTLPLYFICKRKFYARMHIKIRRHWKSNFRVKIWVTGTRGDCGIVTFTSFDLLRLGPVYLKIKNYTLSKVSHRHLRLLANIGTPYLATASWAKHDFSVFEKFRVFSEIHLLFPKTQLSSTSSKTLDRFNFDTVDKYVRLY